MSQQCAHYYALYPYSYFLNNVHVTQLYLLNTTQQRPSLTCPTTISESTKHISLFHLNFPTCVLIHFLTQRHNRQPVMFCKVLKRVGTTDSSN